MLKRKKFTLVKDSPFWDQVEALAKLWQCKYSNAIRRAVLETWLKYVKKNANSQ